MQTNLPFKAGVIEGFFGKTWSREARESGADFLRDNGYQFYMYAPKADAFLRRRWRDPIPGESFTELAALSSRCRQSGIAFGVGLTPFEIYLNYDAAARDLLRSKVTQLNEMGVDILGILFDDMRGDVEGLADLQAQVIGDVCSWSHAQSFIVCPTYYSYDSRLAKEFGPPPKAYLRDFGRVVDPRIEMFWTGEKVISEGYSAEHLQMVAENIGRKPFIWDNYIANDGKARTNHVYLDVARGSWELAPGLVAGLAVNPMNEHYLSRIALCGYQRLINKSMDRAKVLESSIRQLCDQPFADRLLADADLLQNKGLTHLEPETRERLLEWYAAQDANPFAADIAAFLRGEYVFDPQCLTS